MYKKKMSNRQFIDDAVKAHNDYRKRHQVPPLKHNKDISSVAQKWADHLARTGTFQHSKERRHKGDNMGENIAMKYSSSGDDYTGQQAINQWYSEVSKYSFPASSGSGTGHFTQVVWKDSREVGVGRAQSTDGKWFVVANYFPAGNFVGRNKENVFPPKDGKTSPIGADDSASGASGGGRGGSAGKGRKRTKKGCCIL